MPPNFRTHTRGNLALSRLLLIIKPSIYPSYAFAHTSHTHTYLGLSSSLCSRGLQLHLFQLLLLLLCGIPHLLLLLRRLALVVAGLLVLLWWCCCCLRGLDKTPLLAHLAYLVRGGGGRLALWERQPRPSAASFVASSVSAERRCAERPVGGGCCVGVG